tara:strand:+ start:1993 stop:2337 length:345 start_codon:yes stop_codon:yes gene_type:complete
MKDSKLDKIEILIKEEKISEAQFELSKLGKEYEKNPDYLFLRGKVFYLNKLYYAAIDALLIASEFEENNKICSLIAEIYGELGNNELKKKIMDLNLRSETIKSLKEQLSGIYRK